MVVRWNFKKAGYQYYLSIYMSQKSQITNAELRIRADPSTKNSCYNNTVTD